MLDNLFDDNEEQEFYEISFLPDDGIGEHITYLIELRNTYAELNSFMDSNSKEILLKRIQNTCNTIESILGIENKY